MLTAQAIEKLTILLQGRIPEAVETSRLQQADERVLAEKLNQLIELMGENHAIIDQLSRGNLNDITIGKGNFLASPFKELHSRLLHLTWQARRVASGDYKQRVDFMGDFSSAFNAMILSLEENEQSLRRKIEELENALAHITKLEKILPICSFCKRIRHKNTDPHNQDSWVQIEQYITTKTETQFSHSLCPECLARHYGEDE
jgi:hypothetical protein